MLFYVKKSFRITIYCILKVTQPITLTYTLITTLTYTLTNTILKTRLNKTI